MRLISERCHYNGPVEDLQGDGFPAHRSFRQHMCELFNLNTMAFGSISTFRASIVGSGVGGGGGKRPVGPLAASARGSCRYSATTLPGRMCLGKIGGLGCCKGKGKRRFNPLVKSQRVLCGQPYFFVLTGSLTLATLVNRFSPGAMAQPR